MKNWINPDGTVNVSALEDMEASLLATTDQVGKLMDTVLQKGFIPAFVCNHSGLLLPGDFVKEWGRLYGVGYGPSPVSEVLDTDYHTDLPPITPDIRRIEQIMHPVGPSMAQVDRVMVHPLEFTERAAIIDMDDYAMEMRAPILRQKQLENPKGRLQLLQAAWASKKGRF